MGESKDNKGPDAGGSPVVDEEELMDRLSGDMDLLRELVPLFLEDSPSMIADIREAIHSQDPDALRKAAHSLKGAVGNFSAYPAYRAAFRLEDMGTQETLDQADEALGVLEQEMERLQEALKSLISG
jgi:two-component system, sensor histidine kinase and response regulator